MRRPAEADGDSFLPPLEATMTPDQVPSARPIGHLLRGRWLVDGIPVRGDELPGTARLEDPLVDLGLDDREHEGRLSASVRGREDLHRPVPEIRSAEVPVD